MSDQNGGVGALSAAARFDGNPPAPSSEAEVALLDTLPVAILVTDADGHITFANRACQSLYASSAAELVGTHWSAAIEAHDRATCLARLRERSYGQHPLTFEARTVTRAGRQIWTRHSVASLAMGGCIHTIEDISTAKASEEAVREALARERERARVTLECVGDGVICTDAAGYVTYLNAVAEELTGWSREKAHGQPFSHVFKIVDACSGEAVRPPAERAMQSMKVVQIPANCLLLRPDGTELAIEDSAAPIPGADGRPAGAVVVFRDRKLSRENAEKMAHLARHDALTGLPNRVTFSEHFEQAINLARRHRSRVGLLFIDLDNFKQINDRLGHTAGDQMLKVLARKLTACVRGTDLVCRHGGDEFVVLLTEIEEPEDAGRVATKIRMAAARPIHLQGHPVDLELSIGISLYPDDGTDMEALMQRADAAMYQAKCHRGSRYYFYRSVCNDRAQGRL